MPTKPAPMSRPTDDGMTEGTPARDGRRAPLDAVERSAGLALPLRRTQTTVERPKSRVTRCCEGKTMARVFHARLYDASERLPTSVSASAGRQGGPAHRCSGISNPKPR